MIRYILTIAFICFFALVSQAQVRSSVGLGGGVAYPPFNKIYKAGWYSSLHWNIGVGTSSMIDTHIGLANIAVKDYPVGPGIGNTDHLYELGLGYRRYFGDKLFARAGVAGVLLDQAEQTFKIAPNAGIGYDLFITERQSIELSLQTEFVKNYRYYNSEKNISIFSLGVAYKLWYFKKHR
jgi:hypothetical protein